MGPEDWQTNQAQSALTLLSSNPSSRLKLFLSLDCTVLPTATAEDGQVLLDKTVELLRHPGYMLFQGRRLLSTFGGESANFGGWGWEGWLKRLNQELGGKVSLVQMV
jgi:glucan endo-1,3-alpha-glucosidase